jgi:hypothetical protein
MIKGQEKNNKPYHISFVVHYNRYFDNQFDKNKKKNGNKNQKIITVVNSK